MSSLFAAQCHAWPQTGSTKILKFSWSQSCSPNPIAVIQLLLKWHRAGAVLQRLKSPPAMLASNLQNWIKSWLFHSTLAPTFFYLERQWEMAQRSGCHLRHLCSLWAHGAHSIPAAAPDSVCLGNAHHGRQCWRLRIWSQRNGRHFRGEPVHRLSLPFK